MSRRAGAQDPEVPDTTCRAMSVKFVTGSQNICKGSLNIYSFIFTLGLVACTLKVVAYLLPFAVRDFDHIIYRLPMYYRAGADTPIGLCYTLILLE